MRNSCGISHMRLHSARSPMRRLFLERRHHTKTNRLQPDALYKALKQTTAQGKLRTKYGEAPIRSATTSFTSQRITGRQTPCNKKFQRDRRARHKASKVCNPLTHHPASGGPSAAHCTGIANKVPTRYAQKQAQASKEHNDADSTPNTPATQPGSLHCSWRQTRASRR